MKKKKEKMMDMDERLECLYEESYDSKFPWLGQKNKIFEE